MNISHKILFALLGFTSFNASAQQETPPVYGRSILSVSPVQMSERTPTGIGVQYERLIGNSNRFSVYLPVSYSFGMSDPCNPAIKSRIFYAYPGIKFYPAGNQHLVTYAVGPSLALGQGSSNCDCGAEQSITTELKNRDFHSVTEVGAIINNSINVQASKHIYLGGDIGFGASFVNIEDGKNIGSDIMLQINLKVGYRF